MEAFCFGQGDGGGADLGQTFGVASGEAGALQEIMYREAGGEARTAGSRQHMVGAGNIVTGGFRRVAAEEDGAGMFDFIEQISLADEAMQKDIEKNDKFISYTLFV